MAQEATSKLKVLIASNVLKKRLLSRCMSIMQKVNIPQKKCLRSELFITSKLFSVELFQNIHQLLVFWLQAEGESHSCKY